MNRPRISITGLLVAVAILAVVFGILSHSDQVVSDLWNLAVWTIPPLGILYGYGSERTRVLMRSVLATLVYLSAGLLLPAGLGLLTLFLAGQLRWSSSLDTLTAGLGTIVLAMAFVTGWALRGRGPRRSFGVGFAVVGWPFLLLGLAPAVIPRFPVLWTSEALHMAYLVTLGGPAPSVLCLRPDSVFSVGPGVWGTVPWYYLQFLHIGHGLISLIIATAGGLLARTLAARRSALAAPAHESDPVQRPSSAATSFATLLVMPSRAFPERNS